MSSDNGPNVWPPPPSNGYQAQTDSISQKSETWRFCLSCTGQKVTIEGDYQFHSFRWVLNWLDWVRPLACGILGAVVGAIVLLSGTLLWLFYGGNTDWVIDFKLALFLSAVIGIVGGFVCGVGFWFIGKWIVGWQGNKRSFNQHQKP